MYKIKFKNGEIKEFKNLIGADLTDAYLVGANLTCADLTCADLRDAYLRDADLTDANLTGADLTGAAKIEAANDAFDKLSKIFTGFFNRLNNLKPETPRFEKPP